LLGLLRGSIRYFIIFYRSSHKRISQSLISAGRGLSVSLRSIANRITGRLRRVRNRITIGRSAISNWLRLWRSKSAKSRLSSKRGRLSSRRERRRKRLRGRRLITKGAEVEEILVRRAATKRRQGRVGSGGNTEGHLLPRESAKSSARKDI